VPIGDGVGAYSGNNHVATKGRGLFVLYWLQKNCLPGPIDSNMSKIGSKARSRPSEDRILGYGGDPAESHSDDSFRSDLAMVDHKCSYSSNVVHGSDRGPGYATWPVNQIKAIESAKDTTKLEAGPKPWLPKAKTMAEPDTRLIRRDDEWKIHSQ